MTDNFEAAETPGLVTDPHQADPDEDPEQHLGAVLRDPWNDATQTDWADHTVDLDPDTMGV